MVAVLGQHLAAETRGAGLAKDKVLAIQSGGFS
jgi:hypothetical protein